MIYFKSDQSRLLLSQNYIRYGFFDSGIFYEVGGFREGFEGSQDWDLFLRITES